MTLPGQTRLILVAVLLVSAGLSAREPSDQASPAAQAARSTYDFATGPVVQRPQGWDPPNARPSYDLATGPVVAFDEAHKNAGARPYPLAIELLKADGYRPRSLGQKMSAASLADVGVLFIADPGESAFLDIARTHGGRPPTDEEAAAVSLSDEEISTVVAWLKGGGSLLLVVGHEPYPLAAAKLTTALGIPNWPNGSAGIRTDLCQGERVGPQNSGCTGQGVAQNFLFWRADFFPGGKPTLASIGVRQAYQSADAVLARHPITEGRSSAERIQRVATSPNDLRRVRSDGAPGLQTLGGRG